MGMNESHLKPSVMILEGFIAHKILVRGIVKMKVTLWTNERTRTKEIKFYVIDIESPYNPVLGMPFYAAFELVMSMSHQQIKFTTGKGVGFIKSSP